jgi:hypothetical protein
MAYTFAFSTGFAVASNATAGLSFTAKIARMPTARTTTITPAPIHSGFFDGRVKEADESKSSDGARPLAGGTMGVPVGALEAGNGCGGWLGGEAQGAGASGGWDAVVAAGVSASASVCGVAGGGGAGVASTMIDAMGSGVAMAFGGAWGSLSARAARSSALGPLPWRACRSEAESVPAPVNGASSSSQAGRNAAANRSRSPAVRGVPLTLAGALGTPRG